MYVPQPKKIPSLVKVLLQLLLKHQNSVLHSKIHHQHQIIWTSLLTPGLSENSDTTYITCLMLKGQTFNRFALP